MLSKEPLKRRAELDARSITVDGGQGRLSAALRSFAESRG
jgi:hypothetical protein